MIFPMKRNLTPIGKLQITSSLNTDIGIQLIDRILKWLGLRPESPFSCGGLIEAATAGCVLGGSGYGRE
jgi:hypothetical protein